MQALLLDSEWPGNDLLRFLNEGRAIVAIIYDEEERAWRVLSEQRPDVFLTEIKITHDPPTRFNQTH